MTPFAERAVDTLRQALGEAVGEVRDRLGQVAVVVEPARLPEAGRLLRDDPELRVVRLAALTAVDSWPTEPRFELVYQLHSLSRQEYIGLRARVPGNRPEAPSLESVFPSANWFEREVFDLFGVTFTGHSDLRRILMPADWVGHPLRKDYPLGYEEVQFTFSAGDVDRRKPYAKE
jgi:NADH-quinone oxidoreductase subunit C